MAQEEYSGLRDRAYSAWHRRASTRRFVGIETAQNLAMIDLDASLYVEYDNGTKEPLALIETAIDCNKHKAATVTRNLARRANLPAYVVLYTHSESRCPGDPDWPDIKSFRVREIYPEYTEWKSYTPKEWAEFLVQLRVKSARLVDDLWTIEQESCMAEGSNLVKVGALWLKEKNGRRYFSGKVDKALAAGTQVFVYKNDYKTDPKHPDHTLHAILGSEEAQDTAEATFDADF